jgi:hypothetical protein
VNVIAVLCRDDGDAGGEAAQRGAELAPVKDACGGDGAASFLCGRTGQAGLLACAGYG